MTPTLLPLTSPALPNPIPNMSVNPSSPSPPKPFSRKLTPLPTRAGPTREPKTVPRRPDGQRSCRSSQVGDGVQGLPGQHGRLHESPAREHGGGPGRQVNWEFGRGFHSVSFLAFPPCFWRLGLRSGSTGRLGGGGWVEMEYERCKDPGSEMSVVLTFVSSPAFVGVTTFYSTLFLPSSLLSGSRN